jgi:hypothetical protein
MCGHHFEKDAPAAAPAAETNRRTRIRQRTISVSMEDYADALKSQPNDTSADDSEDDSNDDKIPAEDFDLKLSPEETPSRANRPAVQDRPIAQDKPAAQDKSVKKEATPAAKPTVTTSAEVESAPPASAAKSDERKSQPAAERGYTANGNGSLASPARPDQEKSAPMPSVSSAPVEQPLVEKKINAAAKANAHHEVELELNEELDDFDADDEGDSTSADSVEGAASGDEPKRKRRRRRRRKKKGDLENFRASRRSPRRSCFSAHRSISERACNAGR